MAEDILHFGAVRYRVTGNGDMFQSLITYDDQVIKPLLPLTLSDTPGREPTRLASLVTQRARLKVYTTEYDDNVRINRIILYVKPVYTSYPM